MNSYDVYICGVSGGKDSVAAWLWARNNFDPNKVVASFCDTGNEIGLVYEYIAYLRRTVGYIHVIQPKLGFYDLVKYKGMFPTARKRFCTQYLKIEPTAAFVKSYTDRGLKVLQISGTRREESMWRKDMLELEPNRDNGQLTFRPLIEWTTAQVFDYLHQNNVRPNPLYQLGFKRVGCMPCFMCSKRDVRLMVKFFPERVDMIREAEKTVGPHATFYHREFTPPRFHSRTITKRNGEEISINGIDDVVLWSATKWGAKELLPEYQDDPKLQAALDEVNKRQWKT